LAIAVCAKVIVSISTLKTTRKTRAMNWLPPLAFCSGVDSRYFAEIWKHFLEAQDSLKIAVLLHSRDLSTFFF
jgi:hypothetical protein